MLVKILLKVEFVKRLKKILKCEISRQSVQWGPSCSMRTDGRRDGRTEGHRQIDRHDEATSGFSPFCERC